VTTIADAIADIYALGHRNVLDAIAELSEEQLRWRPPRSNSIAFNLWHMARWADHMQSVLPTITPRMHGQLPATTEVWQRDAVAAKWRFPASGLGQGETGMGMDEGDSATLALPDKADLVAYAKQAFAAADHAVRALQDEDFARPAEFDPARVPWARPSDYGMVANWVIAGIRHESRHLGMIEALKGAVGLRGTVTR
jgi:hypothetical protein